jgi:hypothetical protein
MIGINVKLGQVIILTKTLFLEYFYGINFKLGVNVAYGLPLRWLVLTANHPWPSWLTTGSKMLYPKVKFWNWRYHIVQYLKWKLLIAHSRSVKLLTLWRHLMTQWNNLEKETKYTFSQPESIHARMQKPESMHAQMGNLSQWMPECGEGFTRYC